MKVSTELNFFSFNLLFRRDEFAISLQNRCD
jgi:hypothetical protein